MTRYAINYIDDHTETVEADSVEYDTDAHDYTFIQDNHTAAIAPTGNVRSIHRLTDDATKTTVD
ncbi:hypothetical protein PYK79_10850 [Streptomyces sp. ID05-04B]|uniref:hypothetical protein n=1 Tax=Streptomyces sp. ID05-04B TaxID=3028661 RepID=UPI0029C3F2D1|nr:hypothetical protein [Streptomyces sp. ID05-04B]MDX5563751.1 hypothetical protein [Streptomyces sp. ID05-04B]